MRFKVNHGLYLRHNTYTSKYNKYQLLYVLHVASSHTQNCLIFSVHFVTIVWSFILDLTPYITYCILKLDQRRYIYHPSNGRALPWQRQIRLYLTLTLMNCSRDKIIQQWCGEEFYYSDVLVALSVNIPGTISTTTLSQKYVRATWASRKYVQNIRCTIFIL
jgi:hypothetical protein